MAEFNKHTEVSARLEPGDIHTVNVSGGNYAGISITLKDRSFININFQSKGSVSTKELVEMILTAALKVNWDKDYASEYAYTHSENITLEQVAEWKQYHDEQMAEAERL